MPTLFMDEFGQAKPKIKRAVAELLLNPGRSKNDLVKRMLKKANKRRKRLGLKKIKLKALRRTIDAIDTKGYITR